MDFFVHQNRLLLHATGQSSVEQDQSWLDYPFNKLSFMFDNKNWLSGTFTNVFKYQNFVDKNHLYAFAYFAISNFHKNFF
jgi:hypothetical protein